MKVGIIGLSFERVRYEHFQQELVSQNISNIQIPDYRSRRADPFKPISFGDAMDNVGGQSSMNKNCTWSYVQNEDGKNHMSLYDETRIASQSQMIQEQVTSATKSMLSMLQMALQIAS